MHCRKLQSIIMFKFRHSMSIWHFTNLRKLPICNIKIITYSVQLGILNMLLHLIAQIFNATTLMAHNKATFLIVTISHYSLITQWKKSRSINLLLICFSIGRNISFVSSLKENASKILCALLHLKVTICYTYI